MARQGLEIAATGHLTLPLPEPDRDLVLAVKRGEVGRDEVSAMVVDLGRQVTALLDSGRCPLPPDPRLAEIDDWSVQAHERHWFGAKGEGGSAPARSA